jgi:molybdopterin-biosynthesis enzyme MoeA-like protein
MAEFPEGATLIPNPYNRIAGFSVDRHHFLPGFPEMAWPMLDWVLDTLYPRLHRAEREVECAYVVRGAGEGDLVELMNALLRDYPGIKVASLPKLAPGERIVELSVRGEAQLARRAGTRLQDAVTAMGYGCTAL